ncbi:zinc-binding protein A33-like isoform X1 [Oncorhynchus keta]|uniref:zinc-binding protein A33-like isoform X1 n=1 Tax=Oncorhynchus keta TaxID=8018 RepID=UPI00227AC34D|nr:zinc-binding protein A33-like isoform X1 [Oncorhynchus keta]
MIHSAIISYSKNTVSIIICRNKVLLKKNPPLLNRYKCYQSLEHLSYICRFHYTCLFGSMETCLLFIVMDLLSRTDPSKVNLDEPKADQILTLTNNMLLLIHSQTPITKRLIKSYSTEVSLDPETAHPKLVISLHGDSVTYTDTWQELPELPGRFDTTLNVISLQGFSSGRHYWEIDVAGKTYWELGLTYPTISRKGRAEDCWLGRGSDSWAMEFFDGEYTAWHGGVPHQLPVTKHLSRIGVLCSFPAGLVSFLGADSMTPLFSFCVGAFKDCLHLALCPGHDHNGSDTATNKFQTQPLLLPRSTSLDYRTTGPERRSATRTSPGYSCGGLQLSEILPG